MKVKNKNNPIFKGFPRRLKNPDSVEPLEKKLRLAMYSDHKHKTVKEFVGCPRCQKKLDRRKEILKEEGFKSFEQYMMWKKVMAILIDKKKQDEKV